MKKPILYLQTDKRWKDIPYKVPGENATIGGSGCGPACMAMVISTITGKTVTPVDTCNWSVKHGYKAKGQGTYYSYFGPQGKAYGISIKQLNGANLYRNPKSQYHDIVKSHISNGGMVIACMGKGRWTRSGHFILLWGVNSDDTININDPASTRSNRVRGNWDVLKNEVKYYFVVHSKDVPKTKENILKDKYNLSDETINYLKKYEYGEMLISKLASDTKDLVLHKKTIAYILKYQYGTDLIKKICNL